MKSILVIEDNFEIRENLCEILELSNYKVFQASNGLEGVKKAKETIPDLILCDVMMPELDGFGVLKILQKTPNLYHIPFIFLTAKSEKEDLRKGMGLGADDYITKPFDDTDLLEAIEIRLKKNEALQNIKTNSDEGIQEFFSIAKAHEEFEKISLDKELRSYQEKDIIYEEGQNPRWLYFIVSGSVKITQTNEYDKELIVSLANVGEFFGYTALINDSTYSNTAITLTNTTLRLIPQKDFSLLLYNNKDFSSQFIKMIANTVEDKEKKLLDMAYGSVRRKVANALIQLIQENKAKNGELKISFSRENLASLAGVAKETLIRTISDFKSEGLISVEGRDITIVSKQKLEALIT